MSQDSPRWVAWCQYCCYCCWPSIVRQVWRDKKTTNNDLQNIIQKTKDCATWALQKTGEWTHELWKGRQCSCNFIFRVRVMGFNATFKNISVISWRSVLLVEETWVPGENQRPVISHWQTVSHNVSSTPHHERGSNSQLMWW